MNLKHKAHHPAFMAIIFICLLSISACGGDKDQTLGERMGKISQKVKSIDSAAARFSKGASKFARKVESYSDTSVLQKDTNGIWRKK